MPTEMKLRLLAMLLVLLVQQQVTLLLGSEQVVLAALSLPAVLGSAPLKQLATIQTAAFVPPFVRVAAPCFRGAAYQHPCDLVHWTRHHHRT